MEHDLGVYSDWEGDQDFRLQDPNYKSMYVSGNAQGGRIGYRTGGDTPEVLGPVTPGKSLGEIIHE